ncbi:MAG: InlB B-repeat-containing protein, partial [Bacteroidales bacterium]|nr:InlB B-repeat-containing protein [Bacteroidales bacterium]
MLSDTAITAFFAPNEYALTAQANVEGLGSVLGSNSCLYLDTATLTAVPSEHYHFSHWVIGGNGVVRFGNPLSFVVTRDTVVTACFVIDTHSVSVASADMVRGTASGNAEVSYGSMATVSATEFYGYHFSYWSDGSTDNPHTVQVLSDTLLTAFFAKNDYTVTANVNIAGSGSVEGVSVYPYLDTTMLTAVPGAHYHFLNWTVGTNNAPVMSNPLEFVVTRDTVVTACFEIDTHRVNVVASDANMGSVTGNVLVNYGTTTAVSASARYGYHFSHWSDGSTDNPHTVQVLSDTTLTAFFSPNEYMLTTSVNIEGSGSIVGSVSNFYLDTADLIAVPAAHYHFSHWLIGNGGTVNYHNPLTFVVTRDTTVVACFAIDTHSVSVAVAQTERGFASVDEDEVSYGSYVTLDAYADYGYHFSQWSDG